MNAPFGAVVFVAGERGQWGDPAEVAADFVKLARANPKAELTVCVSGYEDDPRELFDVPEVVDFLRQMVGHMGRLLPGAAIADPFGRFSFECRALMFYAAGIIGRDQIEITAPPVNYGGRA